MIVFLKPYRWCLINIDQEYNFSGRLPQRNISQKIYRIKNFLDIFLEILFLSRIVNVTSSHITREISSLHLLSFSIFWWICFIFSVSSLFIKIATEITPDQFDACRSKLGNLSTEHCVTMVMSFGCFKRYHFSIFFFGFVYSS